MSKHMFVILILSNMIIAGCSHMHGHHNEEHASEGMTLNDGKKWKSDTHTMESIQRMRKVAKTIPASKLKKSLKKELNELINGCRMEGADHDALHVYLSELMPTINRLGASPKDSKVQKVRALLDKYSNYFEE